MALGCCKARCALRVKKSGFVLNVGPGTREISQLDLSCVTIEQNVFWFDIAVDYAHPVVQIHGCRDQLPEQVAGYLLYLGYILLQAVVHPKVVEYELVD